MTRDTVLRSRRVLGAAMTSDQWTRTVIEAAQRLGWRVAHFRPARQRDRRTGQDVYRTPVSGDGVGWPDLVLLRDDRAVVAELKTGTGRVQPAQAAWLDAWRAAGAETFVWRPDDLDVVLDVLS